MAMVTALSGAFGLIVIGVAMLIIARLSKAKNLPPNGAIGIRTKDTQRSEKAWSAGHRAAEEGLIRVAKVSAVAAVVPLVVALVFGPDHDSTTVATFALLLGGYLAVIGMLLRVVQTANRAAQKA